MGIENSKWNSLKQNNLERYMKISTFIIFLLCTICFINAENAIDFVEIKGISRKPYCGIRSGKSVYLFNNHKSKKIKTLVRTKKKKKKKRFEKKKKKKKKKKS